MMFEQALQDAWGNTSSKRVAGFLALAMAAGCGAAAFLGHNMEHYFDALLTFTGVCFGFATADHFAPSAHQEAPDAPPAA